MFATSSPGHCLLAERRTRQVRRCSPLMAAPWSPERRGGSEAGAARLRRIGAAQARRALRKRSARRWFAAGACFSFACLACILRGVSFTFGPNSFAYCLGLVYLGGVSFIFRQVSFHFWVLLFLVWGLVYLPGGCVYFCWAGFVYVFKVSLIFERRGFAYFLRGLVC